MKQVVFSILVLLFSLKGFSQNENFIDSTKNNTPSKIVKTKKSIFREGHDPAKAAIFSAVLPGAGQFYNKKYWKIPIVYAGLGGLGYWVGFNAVELKGYTDAYSILVNGDSTSTASYNGYDTEYQLGVKRRETKTNLDISAIALGVWYILNIIDATVDAHLMDFDVNDDISISLRPDFRLKSANNPNFNRDIYTGLSMTMNFK